MSEEENSAGGYEPRRVLFRTADGAVSAVGPEHEQQQRNRLHARRSSGWSSKFAAPYKPLGKPMLELGRSGRNNRTSGSLRSNQRRVVRPASGTQDQNVEDYSGDLKSLELVQNGLTQSKAGFDVLRGRVRHADQRLKCCRAGGNLLELLPKKGPLPGLKKKDEGGKEAEDRPASAAQEKENTSNTPVPPPAAMSRQGSVVPQLNLDRLSKRPSVQTTRDRPSGGVSQTSRSPRPATDRPPSGISRADRIKVILGHGSAGHPVPELTRICSDFHSSVNTSNRKLGVALDRQDGERPDTYRRKFLAFNLGTSGFGASEQLAGMRLQAEKERLRTSLRLFQNRRWYTKLAEIIMADDVVSPAESFLLGRIKKLVEEGVVISHLTVRQLMELFTHPKRRAAFASPSIQGIFNFLCEQFGVSPSTYDEWVMEADLPMPEETQAREEEARERRLHFFRNETVAKHWKKKMEILTLTKDMNYWVSEDVLNTLYTQEELEGR